MHLPVPLPFWEKEPGGNSVTDLQKQCLLTYLGYDCGGIDGIWGERSAAAAKGFQRDQGLEESGVLDEKAQSALLSAIGGSGDWWEDIRYFRRGEFACKCGRFCDGFPAEPERKLVQLADDVRAYFGTAATVSSGVRCAAHNANVGGVANSRHLTGKAVDFCVAGKTAAQVLSYVNQLPGVRYAYAIDGNFVHMDVE